MGTPFPINMMYQFVKKKGVNHNTVSLNAKSAVTYQVCPRLLGVNSQFVMRNIHICQPKSYSHNIDKENDVMVSNILIQNVYFQSSPYLIYMKIILRLFAYNKRCFSTLSIIHLS